ncbi:alpha-amylase family glycosyl hydrolase [Rhodococcus sp. BS-15]|uniref:alpha-amylase family glycosyl hydrolase n=1 Tax=Rhodococcus sp. BS-15 TaxID=1304954 RepID=UPI000AE4E131|nr:alpha-amylase family glycosyl hydrolase [Rhodococcus sp. BS-15]
MSPNDDLPRSSHRTAGGESASNPPGSPFPLGATALSTGTQFAVHAPEADGVEVCLIDPDGGERRVELTTRTFGVRHAFVPGVRPGDRYGFRAHGRWDPHSGRRFNGSKILLDPAARQVTGVFGDPSALLAYEDDPFGAPSSRDSLGHLPLGVVRAADDHVGRPARPEVPWDRTVLYELHVGSFTARNPAVPQHLRGTYLGLAEPAVLEHLARIGITSVELLPVHTTFTEPGVRARGMRNHWGYSTGAYFAPDPRFAAVPGAEVDEFRTMVDALHAAGIEVILDVVYNHTCESAVDGPSISWRGLDAPGYYLLDGRGSDVDLTGCGNTLDSASPAVVRMVCDSLRYWVEDVGVDGFRFDLASTLGRPGGWRFDSRAPLLTAIATDPVLARVKLIAERGTPPVPAIRSVTSEWPGRNGTIAIATRSGASGRASTASANWPRAWPVRKISSRAADACRGRRSTSSPRTTGSPPAIWCPTSENTTRPTAKRTGTGPTTTPRSTTASRGRATIRPSSRPGDATSGHYWQP